jgi:uncharacterized protein
VTGATSGIGAAYARELGRRGFRLILTGRREPELRAVAREIGEERVKLLFVELSGDAAVESVIEACRGRDLAVLVNNAGFGIGKPFLETPLADEERMERVHVLAPLRLVHALAPGMVARGGGAVVNVSSLAAFTPLPRSATYSATKSLLLVFSESLAMELRGTGVRVQALCPGFTHTHFHAALHIPQAMLEDRFILRWMTPEAVVSASLGALRTNRVVCVPGFWNRVIRRLVPLVPRRIFYTAAARVR